MKLKLLASLLVASLVLVGCKTAVKKPVRQPLSKPEMDRALRQETRDALLPIMPPVELWRLPATRGEPIHIDSLETQQIVNSVGVPARRNTFGISGLNAGTTNYIIAKENIEDAMWFAVGSFEPTNSTETVVRTNAQNFIQERGFFRIQQLP